MLTTSPTLLEQLRQPNQTQAWNRFVSLYTPLLLTWAKRQGFHDADAADLVQEVLVKLLAVLPTHQREPGASFRGWLFRVCQNQCRDFRRRVATRELPAADGLSSVDDDSPVSELEETEYRQALVRRGLELIRGDFSETTWAAFNGLMIEGRAVAAVAPELKISENAVHTARHRVLARLRQELDGFLE